MSDAITLIPLTELLKVFEFMVNHSKTVCFQRYRSQIESQVTSQSKLELISVGNAIEYLDQKSKLNATELAKLKKLFDKKMQLFDKMMKHSKQKVFLFTRRRTLSDIEQRLSDEYDKKITIVQRLLKKHENKLQWK
eukprot:154463_1